MATDRPGRDHGPVPASVREPGAGPRGPRLAPPAGPARPTPSAPAAPFRSTRSRPDPSAFRAVLGVIGLASTAALTTAMLPSVAPQPAPAAIVATASQPQPSVVHVTRTVVLQPGQTPPPDATVVPGAQPTPLIKTRVVTRTRQSGGG